MKISPWPSREKEARGCLQHWLQKAITAQKSKGAGKAPIANEASEVEDFGPKSKSKDRVVWLSEVWKMIKQTSEESEM